MTTLKVSREMGNHLLCMRYTKSGANTEKAIHRIKMPPFMIVHHMKNVVSIWISMISLSYISACTAIISGGAGTPLSTGLSMNLTLFTVRWMNWLL